MPADAEQKKGLVHLRNSYSVDETMTKLERALEERGLLIFARISEFGM